MFSVPISDELNNPGFAPDIAVFQGGHQFIPILECRRLGHSAFQGPHVPSVYLAACFEKQASRDPDPI